MAVGDLIEALERAAAADVEALLAGARAEAERLLAEAAAAQARALDDERDRFRAARQADADARIAAATLEWRGRVLAERTAGLDRLGQAVAARLPSLLAGADGDRLFEALARSALAATAGEPAVARCPARLADRCRALAADWPRVRVEDDDAAGSGVVVEVGDGRLRIDATLEAMLQRFWPRLRLEAAVPAAAAPVRRVAV